MEKIEFNTPADTFGKALPIGNGRLGGMIYGGIWSENLLINEDSVWYGSSENRVNPDALDNLQRVRTHIFDENIEEAEKVLRHAFAATRKRERIYQPAGWLEVDYTFHNGIKPIIESNSRNSSQMNCYASDYERTLELKEGVVQERFSIDGKKIKKTYFSSAVDNVIVLNIESEIEFDLELGLSRSGFYEHSGKIADDTIYIDGTLGHRGISFLCGATVISDASKAETVGGDIIAYNVFNATILVSCRTDFYVKNDSEYKSAEYSDDLCRIRTVVLDDLQTAKSKQFKVLLKNHQADYKLLYERVKVDFNGDNYANTYYQYGRYLMITGSRKGNLPLNLQGIWNDVMEPAWDSKFTININAQMNYWPAEMCSLSECHEPLFEHMLRMWDKGKMVARQMYGCRGFVAHHNTDVWGDCAPQDAWTPATYWVLGGAWLATHITTHYKYTKNIDFAKKMYPFMYDNVLFFRDFLVEKDGKLFVCPSVSPENTYILENGQRGCVCYGATMDSQILRDLFEGFLYLSSELNKGDELVECAKTMLERLPENEISRDNRIKEWIKEYKEFEEGHRHISHLYGLCPSHQISKNNTPELTKAASNTIEHRLKNGGGHTGWSCAWISNFYVRLGDGNKAYNMLQKLWRESTFDNYMDNHPRGTGHVFQIDGNMGAIAAMTEMIVSCQDNTIELLPALPDKWNTGYIEGVSVIGGTVDVYYTAGYLEKCIFRAKESGDYLFILKDSCKKITINKGETIDIVW